MTTFFFKALLFLVQFGLFCNKKISVHCFRSLCIMFKYGSKGRHYELTFAFLSFHFSGNVEE